ncbi:PREDICTED: ATP-dependent DNA helicase PIF1-like [Erythranthe guttata]|uniref:ATP-dependent DNA helicase PIF1-like n=1 Tax=Erythranthe guttata TaxID=4155 RepID=UPI00064D98AA|nr:PREDICTED: ATP-dependent DNA helicase PIF1-like [Erythranthe guttata]|eukprot:XP_012835593.1 PREDICTED: ATP-dependent DNA helicase PIF1-like [Erythranthe guttata]
MDVVSNDRGGMFFQYGHGETGKTFICISQQSPQAELFIRAKLIIWDEAPMMHRYCFEALDKTMKSILQVDKLFGGKVVVLRRDFRQILPVVLKASRQDIVHATINSSPLWNFCRVMKLTKNMRLQSCSSPSNVDERPTGIRLPGLLSNMYDPDYFQGRAILAPTNECVEFVNDHLMSLLLGEEKVYLSSDSMFRDEQTMEDNAEIYSTEFLNTIRCSGLRSHALKFKIGAPVMLIRNIDQAKGLCNGTKLQIIRTGIHVLSCKILSGKNIGDMVFIPRMTLIPSTGLPIKFQRRQFPLIVYFAMTINKSQGQTLSHVGLYLPKHVFSHDQLYIALSRVTSRGGIKIFIKLDSGELTNVTRNVVYKEVFHRI